MYRDKGSPVVMMIHICIELVCIIDYDFPRVILVSKVLGGT